MRLVFLLLAFVSVVASLKCYTGMVPWGKDAKTAGLKLKECPEQCCTVACSGPGTFYTCGHKCPKASEFVKGEKCEEGLADGSSCFCNGLVGQCKPAL